MTHIIKPYGRKTLPSGIFLHAGECGLPWDKMSKFQRKIRTDEMRAKTLANRVLPNITVNVIKAEHLIYDPIRCCLTSVKAAEKEAAAVTA